MNQENNDSINNKMKRFFLILIIFLQFLSSCKEKHYQQLIDNYQSKKEKKIEEAQSDANKILEEAQNKADAILKELQGQIKPHQVIQAKKQLGDLKHQKKQVENHENHDLYFSNYDVVFL